ncbi:hypothetical protein HID58_006863 [Brassica napus]|uniref:VQ domain-containing protein n=2 Tax=Brassica napus TaxID=3708 RepID=A0ABQ8ECK9_BRANA|nr:hypothetical protein HID58_006863 [Brassica napus]
MIYIRRWLFLKSVEASRSGRRVRFIGRVFAVESSFRSLRTSTDIAVLGFIVDESVLSTLVLSGFLRRRVRKAGGVVWSTSHSLPVGGVCGVDYAQLQHQSTRIVSDKGSDFLLDSKDVTIKAPMDSWLIYASSCFVLLLFLFFFPSLNYSVMDDQRNSDNHHQHHHLGVNKIGKNIRKDSSNQQNQQQNPQALFFNINKTDFRSIVQQLTGLGSASSVNPPQSTNPPKPPNSRLVKVRPAPLTQVNHHPPPPPVQSDPIAERNNQLSVNPAESPISAYMRYLIESSPVGNQPQLQNQNPTQPSPGLIPSHQSGPSPMLFQSPASQFVLSPPPRSPFPILSPNFFAFSPRFIAGGNEPLPPPSPGFFFPLLSPLWKSQ